MRTTPAPLLLLLAACSGGSAPKPVAPKTEPAPQAALTPAGETAAKPRPLQLDPAAAGELTFTAAAGWQVETPGQGRRMQFRLPRAEGDPEDATLWVTDFGGGTREMNYERWAAEFELPDGKPGKEGARQSTRKVGDLEAYEVDVSGVFVARMAPNEPATTKKENYRQIAVILEGGKRPWYVKVRGPEATIAKWESSIRTFVDSARRAP